MAGEEGSFNRSTTKSMERAADAAVDAGEEYVLKTRNTTRKAAIGDKCPPNPRATKRKAKREAIGRSKSVQPSYVAAAHTESVATKGEQASAKRMTRLPQEEVHRILSHAANEDRAPPEVKALIRLNRDLWPSPEEEEKTDSYGPRAYIETEEEFSKFQARVRREYAVYGYVEVDNRFLAARAKVRSWNDQERVKALNGINFSGHEDLKRFFNKTWP
ncbi:unnamed protein product [Alopecurus aequalis]